MPLRSRHRRRQGMRARALQDRPLPSWVQPFQKRGMRGQPRSRCKHAPSRSGRAGCSQHVGHQNRRELPGLAHRAPLGVATLIQMPAPVCLFRMGRTAHARIPAVPFAPPDVRSGSRADNCGAKSDRLKRAESRPPRNGRFWGPQRHCSSAARIARPQPMVLRLTFGLVIPHFPVRPAKQTRSHP